MDYGTFGFVTLTAMTISHYGYFLCQEHIHYNLFEALSLDFHLAR